MDKYQYVPEFNTFAEFVEFLRWQVDANLADQAERLAEEMRSQQLILVHD
jgi:hypothetical protein